jgi:hypothetical protein
MIRIRAVSGFTKAALGASLLTLLAVACDEEGKTVPARCVEGVDQPIFDIKTEVDAGAPPDYSAIPDHDSPCVTNTGHAISPVPSGGTATGGTSSGGTSAGGTDGGAPAGGSDAGAGGS